MSYSLRRLRGPFAALLLAAGAALAGCTIGGRAKPPQPPPAAATPAPAAVAPVIVTPLGPASEPGPETAPAGAAGNKTVVALLVPLTGPSAPLGQAMLDAAQMALFDLGDERLQLVVRDSGGTGAAAAAAAQAAVGAGARLILGPLLQAEVEAAKPVAQGASVAMVAFSSATQLAGDGTWLMSFDPRQEIQRVVVYAHAHDRNRFAVLAPQGPYGDIAVAALRDAAQIAGATLGRAARYDPAGDLSDTVQRFASGGDFDAVLLPEGGARLKALAPQLPYHGVDPDRVKLIGTGLWADQSLATEPSLVGGWYAAPAPELRADFEKRFEATYQHAPPLLATLGYDATALAAVLAHAPGGPDFSAKALTTASGFAGVNGIFRLLPDGIVERGLAVLEIHREGATVIDPAPQTFQRPQY